MDRLTAKMETLASLICLLPLFILIQQIKAEYALDIKEWRNCEVEHHEDILTTSDDIIELNGLRIFNAEMNLKIPLDSSFTYRVALKVNERVMAIRGKVCRDVHVFIPALWKKLAAEAGVPAPYECPIPAGDYSVTEFSVEPKHGVIPFDFDDDDEIEIRAEVEKDDKTLICREIVAIPFRVL